MFFKLAQLTDLEAAAGGREAVHRRLQLHLGRASTVGNQWQLRIFAVQFGTRNKVVGFDLGAHTTIIRSQGTRGRTVGNKRQLRIFPVQFVPGRNVFGFDLGLIHSRRVGCLEVVAAASFELGCDVLHVAQFLVQMYPFQSRDHCQNSKPAAAPSTTTVIDFAAHWHVPQLTDLGRLLL